MDKFVWLQDRLGNKCESIPFFLYVFGFGSNKTILLNPLTHLAAKKDHFFNAVSNMHISWEHLCSLGVFYAVNSQYCNFFVLSAAPGQVDWCSHFYNDVWFYRSVLIGNTPVFFFLYNFYLAVFALLSQFFLDPPAFLFLMMPHIQSQITQDEC